MWWLKHEHFFKTLKTEQIYGNKLKNKDQMKLVIFEFGNTEKKTFVFKIQNNRIILESKK
jgi:hypothetical protein